MGGNPRILQEHRGTMVNCFDSVTTEAQRKQWGGHTNKFGIWRTKDCGNNHDFEQNVLTNVCDIVYKSAEVVRRLRQEGTSTGYFAI